MLHCQLDHQLKRPPGNEPAVTLSGAPADPDLRIGDIDRQRVAALLGEAAGAGYLRLDEVDERLTTVWSATTSGELSAVASDLPVELRRARARREAAAVVRDVARSRLPAHLGSYLSVMALLVAVWLVIGLTGGSWYPWPIWPALGWGIGVVRHVRAATTAEPT